MSPVKHSKTIKKKRKETGKLLSKKGVLAIERRKHPRFTTELPLDYSRVESKEDSGGIVANASKGGILVYLPERLEIGDRLKVEVFFAKASELSSLKGIAKVAWADLAADESWGEHRYGLQFQSIEKGDLDKLKGLLKTAGEIPSSKKS
jgi:c-di-GMP-binding flagellar brake protein YcgR